MYMYNILSWSKFCTHAESNQSEHRQSPYLGLILKEVINLSTDSLVIGFHSPIRDDPLHNINFVSFQFFTEPLFWLTF